MINKNEIAFRYTRGKGKGGQHRNKTDSCVYAKHIPTDIEVMVDGRDQHKNKRDAIKALEKKVEEYYEDLKAINKKAHRDIKIKDKGHIRTYNYKRNEVKDHRSKKTCRLDKFLDGQIDFHTFSTKES